MYISQEIVNPIPHDIMLIYFPLISNPTVISFLKIEIPFFIFSDVILYVYHSYYHSTLHVIYANAKLMKIAIFYILACVIALAWVLSDKVWKRCLNYRLSPPPPPPKKEERSQSNFQHQ